MPESIKQTEVNTVIQPALIAGKPFQVQMAGKNEIMVLHSMYYWFHGTLVAGDNEVKLGLWRKTDSNPADLFADGDADDMLWNLHWGTFHAAESVRSSYNEHVIFPLPVVLIRAPRMLIRTSVITSLELSVRLYYQLKVVSDSTMAELMVKDHE
jgi:hypothetical protein